MHIISYDLLKDVMTLQNGIFVSSLPLHLSAEELLRHNFFSINS